MRKVTEASTNRLIREKSPYLLQHAFNPVDWYPWGEEALERAKRENKPIFLSIGYSSCHWCHVMERESFEDDETAELMNRAFVCVKVDREERPDVDEMYMAACQMMTGSGGWPLTLVLTPDLEPFFAATYLPRESAHGRIGMRELVPAAERVWKEQRGRAEETGERVAAALREVVESQGGELERKTLDDGYERLLSAFDEDHGGFGRAPKFPTPTRLTFLLRYWRRSGNEEALRMVERTLHSMKRGGIFDHLGKGFHRYSTDSSWHVPHFEKMLYDQALLTIAYAEAFQATANLEYARTMDDTITYVLREMRSPEGGFFSSEDADSEGIEGKFYLWSEAEIRDALTTEEAAVFLRVYDLRVGDGIGGELTGGERGVLRMRAPPDAVAASSNLREEDFESVLDSARSKLLDRRARRTRPEKDRKILADWNGLMIAALAKAHQATGRKEYLQAATAATEFLLERMVDRDGRLRHRYRDGHLSPETFLDDYAFVSWGLIELYEASYEPRWLARGMELTDRMVDLFRDETGGFYLAPEGAVNLIARRKEVFDGALPSGNSVAVLNLLRLARLTGEGRYETIARRTIEAFAGSLASMPESHTLMLSALDFAIGPSFEVVVAGGSEDEGTRSMLRAVQESFIPNAVVIFSPSDQSKGGILDVSSTAKRKVPVEGKATAHVCNGNSCLPPTTDVETMLRNLLPARS